MNIINYYHGVMGSGKSEILAKKWKELYQRGEGVKVIFKDIDSRAGHLVLRNLSNPSAKELFRTPYHYFFDEIQFRSEIIFDIITILEKRIDKDKILKTQQRFYFAGLESYMDGEICETHHLLTRFQEKTQGKYIATHKLQVLCQNNNGCMKNAKHNVLKNKNINIIDPRDKTQYISVCDDCLNNFYSFNLKTTKI